MNERFVARIDYDAGPVGEGEWCFLSFILDGKEIVRGPYESMSKRKDVLALVDKINEAVGQVKSVK